MGGSFITRDSGTQTFCADRINYLDQSGMQITSQINTSIMDHYTITFMSDKIYYACVIKFNLTF